MTFDTLSNQAFYILSIYFSPNPYPATLIRLFIRGGKHKKLDTCFCPFVNLALYNDMKILNQT